MRSETAIRLTANILMGMIRKYYADLAEFYAGDFARFTRMVVDGGKQIPSASPAGWATHICNLAPECVDQYPEEITTIVTQLEAWGLSIDKEFLNVSIR